MAVAVAAALQAQAPMVIQATLMAAAVPVGQPMVAVQVALAAQRQQVFWALVPPAVLVLPLVAAAGPVTAVVAVVAVPVAMVRQEAAASAAAAAAVPETTAAATAAMAVPWAAAEPAQMDQAQQPEAMEAPDI